MRHTAAICRLCGLAIGVALAATPAIAAAAPETDVSFDPIPAGVGATDPGFFFDALPARGVPTGPDIDISLNGTDIYHTPGHTAEAFSGPNDFAIAIGTDSHAAAGAGDFGGQFDTAFADGTGAFAESGLGNFDSASASGTGALAEAGGVETNMSSYDVATAIGNLSQAQALPFSATTPSGFDVALADNPFHGGIDEAMAGGGIFNTAEVFGENSIATAGFGGDYDLGEVIGNNLTTNFATGGSFLTEILTFFGDFHF